MISTRVRLAALVAVLAVPCVLPAQAVHLTTPPEVRAIRLTGEFLLDGRLDDAVWQGAQPATDLRQNQPEEGEPATQRTEVRFAFDDAAIYVGARMFDDRGAAGVQTRLMRRDADINTDYVQVIFDTYHDHIGRLFFLVNPSGVKNDANGLGGGGDNSWDPVWEVKTTIDSLGWTAEMRIPFAQLRFPATAAEQTWGLQIWRQVNRLNELSQWAFWGLQEQGGPPRFGHLTGLVVTRAPGKAELLPYLVGRSANVPVNDPGDPFEDPHALDGRAGLDARVLLTSNLTLNATFNPDFGQVEVDPAVVNLSAFETSFEERRPFFIEGAGYFGFGGLNCYFCSNVSSLSMFYTRRVGRSPQAGGNVSASGGVYADMPENTTILGAAKLTGRTSSGWSIGALNALTRRERATFERTDGSRSEATVEPLANYFVGRVAKDLRGGATVIRAMGTSVWRDLDDPFLEGRLTKHAESFGLSTDMYFGKRDYRLMAQVAGTQVTGSASAIARLDTASARYLQRPDRKDLYTPGRTQMRGLGAYTRFSRETGHMLWEVSGNLRTPSFENNDISFLREADYIYMGGNILPQWTKPTKSYRNLFFIAGGQQRYNFDGDLTDRQLHAYASMQLLSYWNWNVFYIWRPSLFDDRLSRGGPVLRRPGVNVWSFNLSSDWRKNVYAETGSEINRDGDGFWDWSAYLNLRLQPASNVSLSFGPSYFRGTTGAQFVTRVADSTVSAGFAGTRYVFADLFQKSLSMNTRFNVTFSPNLTLELFVQPLISSGAYSRFKEYAAPRSLQRLVYGVDVGTDPIKRGNSVYIDPDGAGPAARVVFPEPNFTFRSLRGNAVLRWEYRPGSTLYLVWARNGSSSLTRGLMDLGEDIGALFEGPAENIFLIKVSYWLGL